MPEEDQTSSGFNLPHKKGTALLRRGKLPAIDCPVTEITKIGCACRILWKTVESGKVQAWKMVLAPGVSLDLTLTAPPYLLSVPLTGRVQHLEKSTEGHQDVVIHFSNLDAEIASRLRAAVDALSTPEKQKSAAKVLERNEPAVTSNLRSTRLIRLAGQCKGKSIEDLLVVFKK